MNKPLFLSSLVATLAILPLSAEDNALGKAGFETCKACHGPDGKGIQAGDKKMAASMHDSKIVNGDPSVMALAVMKGIKQENSNYMVPMAPLETAFPDDAKFAAVLTYVRKNFGNNASAITAEDVAKYRIEWKDYKEPVSRAKLAELNAAKKAAKLNKKPAKNPTSDKKPTVKKKLKQ